MQVSKIETTNHEIQQPASFDVLWASFKICSLEMFEEHLVKISKRKLALDLPTDLEVYPEKDFFEVSVGVVIKIEDSNGGKLLQKTYQQLLSILRSLKRVGALFTTFQKEEHFVKITWKQQVYFG